MDDAVFNYKLIDTWLLSFDIFDLLFLLKFGRPLVPLAKTGINTACFNKLDFLPTEFLRIIVDESLK